MTNIIILITISKIFLKNNHKESTYSQKIQPTAAASKQMHTCRREQRAWPFVKILLSQTILHFFRPFHFLVFSLLCFQRSISHSQQFRSVLSRSKDTCLLLLLFIYFFRNIYVLTNIYIFYFLFL